MTLWYNCTSYSSGLGSAAALPISPLSRATNPSPKLYNKMNDGQPSFAGGPNYIPQNWLGCKPSNDNEVFFNRFLHYAFQWWKLIYIKRTNVMQLGSMFICNCNIALHVSDAFCVRLQEHLEIVVAASGEWHGAGWGIQQGVQGRWHPH